MQPILSALSPVKGKEASSSYSYMLSREKIEMISQVLKQYMLDKKPFLKIGYCIRDLATEIGVPAYQVSAYINQKLGMNFNDYFNWFRVRHCQDLMRNGLVERLNLRGLAFRCGFNNRNTLTTAFKKFTGLTPSEYSKSVNAKNSSLYIFMAEMPVDKAAEK
jgi:AraC-like DNA-binding protein